MQQRLVSSNQKEKKLAANNSQRHSRRGNKQEFREKYSVLHSTICPIPAPLQPLLPVLHLVNTIAVKA